MEFLYGIVMTLVIGFMACVFAALVISRIGDEQRRNSDYALAQIERLFNQMPRMVTDTFMEVQKLAENQQERTAKKTEEKQNPKDIFEGLDEWPEI